MLPPGHTCAALYAAQCRQTRRLEVGSQCDTCTYRQVRVLRAADPIPLRGLRAAKQSRCRLEVAARPQGAQ